MAARFEHFQSSTHMSVSYFAKGVDAAASSIALSPCGTQLEARFVLPTGEPLFSSALSLYSPAASFTTSFTPMRCEVRLLKLVPGMWPALELPAGAVRPALPSSAGGSSGAAAEAGAAALPPPPPPSASASAPSSAPSAAAPKKKDWGQLLKEEEAEEAARKPEGEEALMKLFQGIFKDANEDTRKAMIKSFQTSGGTVLSTNWKEVAQTDYEKKAKEEREGMAGGGSS